MELKLIKEDNKVTMKMDKDYNVEDISNLLLNGIVLLGETILEKDSTLERKDVHDYLVVLFSSAMLTFDPASKDYKTLGEEL